MSLVTETFILFSALLVLIYFLLPKKMQWVCLLVFSLLFYLYSGPKNIIFILITALSAYLVALCIGKVQQKTKAYIKEKGKELSKDDKKAYKKKKNALCKWLMTGALLLNIAILCVFKYSDFFLAQINNAFKSSALPDSLGLIIPLGISFYTFQTIGYVVDVYWQKCEPQKNFAKMLLFVSFFPQITQGPISDYNTLAPQLFEGHKFDYSNLSLGAQRMMWGFFKKMVVADRLAPLVQTAFAEYSQMTGNQVLLSAFLYSLQIYTDFSGYMDIVCGLCQALGIKLTENFERPYFSKSVAEYWRRWHISLGVWFKTYIYYPIAVSRFAKTCTQNGSKFLGKTFGKTIGATIALVAVWFLTGFWHGASWTYIAWGGINGIVIIVTLWLEPIFDKIKSTLKIRQSSFWWRAFATLRTFFVVTMIKVFPEVGSFSDGVGFWKHCFINWNFTKLDFSFLYPITQKLDLFVIVGSAILIFATSLLQRKKGIRARLSTLPFALRCMIFTAMFFAIILLGIPAQNSGGGFLYAQF